MKCNEKEADSMRTVPVKRVYEKPVLTPLGHMAQVTQKSGANVDNVINPTRAN
ncbi:hypothetical protein BQ8482_111613 [Mesorhizobium delmotii]|uniref:Uncharacterized protein n=1 Tax=Mesorhizobium delmotii TaxID=1631247 RepID=A0A2P9AEX2_9HYPH|nr:hypothetical protein BQ8482_111613 [Mesorhizobium delmotii]